MLRKFVRRSAVVGTAGAAAVLWNYRKDYTELQFDAATASADLLNLLDAESAHNWGIWAAKQGIVPRESRVFPQSLRTRVWNRDFANPIGLAAGFDKNAEGVEGLMGMGFGFVEIGSVTPLPQPGNPQPRVFRLPELSAVINRFGFNSLGVDAVAANLAGFRARAAEDPSRAPAILGVNLGKNKTSEDAAADYCLGASKLGKHADYLVINVSSPNTQSRKELELIIRRMRAARDAVRWDPARGPPPVLVKISPDLPEVDRRDVAAVALQSGIDGLIVSNTTLHRPQLVADHPCGHEAGGLSGEPLREEANAALKEMYRLTKGQLPIIGCGGIATGRHAYERIRAGASLVQLYTGIAYGGPALIPRLKRELAECLQADDFRCVADAVGADHK